MQDEEEYEGIEGQEPEESGYEPEEEDIDTEGDSDDSEGGLSEEEIESRAEQIRQHMASTHERLSRYEQNALVQEFVKWSEKGYSPKQILQALNKAVQDSEREPEFNTPEEEVEYKLSQRLQKEVAPLKEKLSRMEMERIEAEAVSTNDTLLYGAINQAGVEFNPNKDMNKVLKAVNDLYPGINLQYHKLSPSQAKAIVREAFDGAQRKQGRSSDIARSASAPRIAGGKTVKGQGSGGRESAGEMSRYERIRSFHDLP